MLLIWHASNLACTRARLFDCREADVAQVQQAGEHLRDLRDLGWRDAECRHCATQRAMQRAMQHVMQRAMQRAMQH
eukprot:1932862-Prymnesium_polylepis.1